MKIKYLKEDFRKIDDLKASAERKLTADDVRVSAGEAMVDILRPDVEKILVEYFVTPRWWVQSTLANSNLRPGNQVLYDYSAGSIGIHMRYYDEKIEYLHESFPYELTFKNNQIYLTLLLRTCDSAMFGKTSRGLIFESNSVFTYLNMLDKEFNENFKYPVNITYKIKPGKDYLKGESDSLTDIKKIIIGKHINISDFANFFKTKLVKDAKFSDDIELEIINRIDDTDLSKLFEIGDIVKFKNVSILVTDSYIARLKNKPMTNGYNPVKPMLKNLEGIDNILNSTTGNIIISSFYLENKDFNNYIQNNLYNFKKYIQLVQA